MPLKWSFSFFNRYKLLCTVYFKRVSFNEKFRYTKERALQSQDHGAPVYRESVLPCSSSRESDFIDKSASRYLSLSQTRLQPVAPPTCTREAAPTRRWTLFHVFHRETARENRSPERKPSPAAIFLTGFGSLSLSAAARVYTRS